jgi:uncharacterized membrane protein YfcA
MPYTHLAIVYSLACVYFGGCVKGLTGFGFSLVAVATLVVVAPPSLVVPVVLLMNSLMNLILLYGARRHVDARRALPLGVAGIAGLPLGAYILAVADAATLRVVIGIVILVFAVALFTGFRKEIRRERLGSALVGFTGGLLNGSTGTGGPPVVLFLSNLGISKLTFRANLIAYFVCINLAALPFFYARGILTAEVMRTLALLLPAFILGSLTGTRLLGRVSEEAFRRITLAIVAAAAVMAVVAGLRGLR